MIIFIFGLFLFYCIFWISGIFLLINKQYIFGIFWELFTTFHFLIILKNLKKNKNKLNYKELKPFPQSFIPKSSNEYNDHNHIKISDLDERYCPFCGALIKQETRVCPKCHARDL